MNVVMYVEPCLHPFSITIPVHMYVSPVQLPTTPRAFSPRGMLGPLPGQAGSAGTLSLLEQSSTTGGWVLVDK